MKDTVPFEISTWGGHFFNEGLVAPAAGGASHRKPSAGSEFGNCLGSSPEGHGKK